MVGRKGDIILNICQDNEAHQLRIEAINENLGKLEPLIGYRGEELVGTLLDELVADNVLESIEDNLDYDLNGRDLADVLNRTPGFGVKTKSGEERKLKFMVHRDVTMDMNPRFILLMRSKDIGAEGLLQALEVLKPTEVIDPITQLPDADSFIKKAEIVQRAVSDQAAMVTLALMGIDDFAREKTEHADILEVFLREVAMLSQHNFRDSDVIGYDEEGRYGILLIESDAPSAVIPFNRLRANISAKPLKLPGDIKLPLSLSVAYHQMLPDERVDETMKMLEEALKDCTGNQIIEV